MQAKKYDINHSVSMDIHISLSFVKCFFNQESYHEELFNYFE